MRKRKESDSPVILEGQVLQALPAPQIKLATLEDCRREMARVYRDARTYRIESQDASRLVYMLSQIGKLLELTDIEKRVELLEKRNNDQY
jgi:hypothetical protein